MISENIDTRCPKCGYEYKRRTPKPKRCPNNTKCTFWMHDCKEEEISVVPVTDELKGLAKKLLDEFIEFMPQDNDLMTIDPEVYSEFLSTYSFISLLIDVARENGIENIRFNNYYDSIRIFKVGD